MFLSSLVDFFHALIEFLSWPTMPLSKALRVTGLGLGLLSQHAAAQSRSDILQFVDPIIGTANGGHAFAGATLPFGMAKAVPDSVSDGQGGFATKGGKIKGFSHMHDSGTGGVSTQSPFALDRIER